MQSKKYVLNCFVMPVSKPRSVEVIAISIMLCLFDFVVAIFSLLILYDLSQSGSYKSLTKKIFIVRCEQILIIYCTRYFQYHWLFKFAKCLLKSIRLKCTRISCKMIIQFICKERMMLLIVQLLWVPLAQFLIPNELWNLIFIPYS